MSLFDDLKARLTGSPRRFDPGRVTRVVNDRVMLLGLDGLYREAIKPHERGELLACAKAVAATLGTGPASVPVEGYYGEDADLTAYFLLMRALQFTDRRRTAEVERAREFRRLLEVTTSPIFGRPLFVRNDREYLLPLGRDPLGDALDQTTDWSVPTLADLANTIARAEDSWSLVGLAARARDPVVLAAVRESVALYADFELALGIPPTPVFVWQVDPELARPAGRFVQEFNRLFGASLPVPEAAHAGAYWRAYEVNQVIGRCVRLGQSPDAPPRYYHWAVRWCAGDVLDVDAFWSEEVWTTDRYRRQGRGRTEAYRPKWRQTFSG